MIRLSRLIGGLAVGLVCAVLGYEILTFALAAEEAVVIPAPAVDNQKAAGPLQTAVVAGGCFWGVHGVYQHVRGTRQVLSGYSGGTKTTADYETVSRGDSGHAESVEIRFDPKELSYGEILQIYFSVAHDPTQLNRQGPTWARSTARRSSTPTNRRSESPRRTSPSSIARRCSADPS